MDAEVTIRSNHLPLKKFLNKKTMNSKVNNWVVELEQFRLHLEWIPGTRNLLADSLSHLLDVVPDAQKTKEPEDHEFGSIKENSTDEKKAQDTDSEFPEHSHNSWMESAVKTFELKFEEKPIKKRTLLSGSECQEDSQKSRIDPCVKITEHEDLREIKLPLKPKLLQQLQKNDT